MIIFNIQVKKSFLDSLGIDLYSNSSAVSLLFENFLLGVRPLQNGSDPWTAKEKAR